MYHFRTDCFKKTYVIPFQNRLLSKSSQRGLPLQYSMMNGHRFNTSSTMPGTVPAQLHSGKTRGIHQHSIIYLICSDRAHICSILLLQVHPPPKLSVASLASTSRSWRLRWHITELEMEHVVLSNRSFRWNTKSVSVQLKDNLSGTLGLTWGLIDPGVLGLIDYYRPPAPDVFFEQNPWPETQEQTCVIACLLFRCYMMSRVW